MRQQLPEVLLMAVAAALLLLSSCAPVRMPDSSTEQPQEMAPKNGEIIPRDHGYPVRLVEIPVFLGICPVCVL